MKTTGNRVLITGGATGIGFALAEIFVKSGNEVAICGRRGDKLQEAKQRIPEIGIKKCDVSDRADLKSLYEWIDSDFSGMNVLVNNAGVQRAIDFRAGASDSAVDEEIDINLKSQIKMAAHFIPALSKRKEAAIVNISSGLGFVPIAAFPVYCATKAAMHSFSVSLRHQLRQTPIKVFEVVPPIVHDTELKGSFLEKSDMSVSSAEVAGAVIEGMGDDEYEIPIGPSRAFMAGSRSELDQAFARMNR